MSDSIGRIGRRSGAQSSPTYFTSGLLPDGIRHRRVSPARRPFFMTFHKEALRHWVRQTEADTGRRRDLLTTDEREELKRLRKEVAELRRANAILKEASVYFAQELDLTR